MGQRMGALPGTTGRRRVYLMRHGHVDYTSREVVELGDPRLVHLTPLGREQAQAAGEALAEVPFDIAVSSGLNRTNQTAEIVLRAHPNPPPLRAEPRLEEVHSGEFIPYATMEELNAGLTFTWEKAGEPGARFFEGGEPFADAYDRAVSGLEDLLATPGWANALVVAHEGINRLLLGWMCGAGPGAAIAFEQDLANINVLDFDMVPAEATGPAGEALPAIIQRRMIKAVNITPYAWLKAGLHLTSFEAIFTRPNRAA
jgi:probable phosphoglycerate mutase